MAKVKKLGLQKKQKSISTLPKAIRKKSLKGKGKKTMVPKTEKFGDDFVPNVPDDDFVPNVPNDDFVPNVPDDDDDISDEDAELIEKTRMGESFPINTNPMDESEPDEDGKEGKESLSMDLDHLIENDPDFYQYLLKNEKSLLEFEDEEEEESDDEDEPSDVKVTDKLLQSWSTELKRVDKTVIRQVIVVLKHAVDQVSGKSEEGNTKHRIRSEEGNTKHRIRSEERDTKHRISPEHFNEIIKLCFLHLTPALYKSLGLDPPIVSDVSKCEGESEEGKEGESEEGKEASKGKKKRSVIVDPSKCPGWKKMVGPIKMYLSSLLSVLNSITNESLTCSVLRHCLHLIPFISCYPHLVKRFLDKVTNLWSSERSEKIRILSFLFILRLLKRDERPGQKSAKSDQKSGKKDQKSAKSDLVTSSNQLDTVLRKMYLSFVKNCRLTNVETWPFINFMKQSLVELYSLDQAICYRQTFVFLRQTAINLRNAMSNSSPDGHKNIYNWAFIHSLCLWQQLLTTLYPSPVLKPLIYPLVQVMIGTIQLSPCVQFIPVKLHLVRSLIQLSKETEIFIPISHLVVDALNLVEYQPLSASGKKGGKKGKKEAGEKKRTIDLNSVIKVSKGDSSNAVFREEVIKTIFTLLLEHFSTQSHRISFPEITFVTCFKLKKFVKDKCKSANDGKLLKQLVEKIEENNRFIINRRKTVDFKFSDTDAVNKWESEIKQEAGEICPINVFYNKWKTIRDTKERKEIINRKKLIQEKRAKKGKKNSIEDGMIKSENDDQDEEEDDFNSDGEEENGFNEEMEEGGESDGEEAELIYDDEDGEDESD